MKKDAFYTPVPLADYMASLVRGTPDVIADFASGDGALLSAARRRFPGAALIATDVCESTIEAVKSNFLEVHTSACDFLAIEAREKNATLREARGLISVVLMNPPFSCRGGRKSLASIGGKTVPCSQAMAFVATALTYLAVRGEIIALLPAGCLDAEKDHLIWKAIRSIAEVEVLSSHGHKTFDDCSPRTCVVRIRKAFKARASAVEVGHTEFRNASANGSVRVFRGRLQMHSAVPTAANNGVSLVHSTQLQNTKLIESNVKVARHKCDVITGPAVLIPRVGLPKRSKLVRLKARKAVILSDCVIAICCDSEVSAERLLAKLTLYWPAVERAYGGTGAPYLTIRKLTGLLFGMNYTVTCHAKGSRQLHQCIESAIHARLQILGPSSSPKGSTERTESSVPQSTPVSRKVGRSSLA